MIVDMHRRLVALAALACALMGCTSDQAVNPLRSVLVLSPEQVDFGDVVVHYTSDTHIEVVNGGRGDLRVHVGFGGTGHPFTLEWDEAEIPRDDRETLGLTCAPGTYKTYADMLVVESNDPDRPRVEVPLSCRGVHAPTPVISLEPTTLDFGDVAPGESAVLWSVLQNNGDGDLEITRTTQYGSGAFELAVDPQGITVNPGTDQFMVLFTYTPTNEDGDNGSLVIESNDPTQPETTLTLLGNGGGDYDYPVAVIEGPTSVDPPETLYLDGSESYDPAGYDLTYHWTLSLKPVGSAAVLGGTAGDLVDMFADLAGDYQVTLRVENELGVFSVPAKHDISAIPRDDIRVEMYWDAANSDLDLHLADGDSPMFSIPGDCTYCNRRPDWGVIGYTGDDPTLDLDDLSGYGPENINIEYPADGEYVVRVHYFEDNGAGAVTATVKIYLDGDLSHSDSRVLTRDQRWLVGTVLWPDGLVRLPEGADISTGGRRSCYEP